MSKLIKWLKFESRTALRSDYTWWLEKKNSSFNTKCIFRKFVISFLKNHEFFVKSQCEEFIHLTNFLFWHKFFCKLWVIRFCYRQTCFEQKPWITLSTAYFHDCRNELIFQLSNASRSLNGKTKKSENHGSSLPRLWEKVQWIRD